MILLGLMGYTLLATSFYDRLLYLAPLVLYSLLILRLQPKAEDAPPEPSLREVVGAMTVPQVLSMLAAYGQN